MMNRQAFKQSFLAEIMTRALTLTPGDNDMADVKVIHDVMKELNVGMNLPAGALVHKYYSGSIWGRFQKLFCALRPTFEKLFRGVERNLRHAPNLNRAISMICTVHPTFMKTTLDLVFGSRKMSDTLGILITNN